MTEPPQDSTAQAQQALALYQTGRMAEADALYHQLLAAEPARFDALHMSALIALQQGDPARALALIDRALVSDPGSAIAHELRGGVLRALGRRDEALASFDRAVALAPDAASAHNNRGTALQDGERWDEALAAYDRALALQPDHAEAHFNRGSTLQAARRTDEAIAAYERALRLRPDFAKAWRYRAAALQDAQRPQEALESYQRALTYTPADADAWAGCGALLQDLGRLDEALACHARALALAPDRPYVYGAWLYLKMRLCDWEGADARIRELAARIERGEPCATPFMALAFSASPALQRHAAELWCAQQPPVTQWTDALRPAALGPRRADARIRIGYYSADFHEHATTYLMAELLELHDRERFELIAFSYGPDIHDAMRARVVAACDRFIDVRAEPDRAVAQRSRELGIDIAVDLKGYTQHHRLGIFAARAAPLQVGYLGYPGTLGSAAIDYLIADGIVVPPASRQHYTEKIVQLPGSYQVNDRTRRAAEATPTRAALGLPPAGVVFCCFNNSYKILPDRFAAWMRLLQRIEGSVLWLLEDNPTAAANLRREAAARGIAAERLVFAPRLPLADHLARLAAADLFLDTGPCNAHTTASDALWVGLPVLTLAGAAFADRVAASLLHAVGLPELVVTTLADYEALAVTLASDPARLRGLKQKLARNRTATPLFDTPAYARALERAYTRMHERRLAGLPPDHIVIEA